MSLHHLAEKLPFYTMLRQTLRPGGLLVFGDYLEVALPHIEQRYWNAWLAFAKQPGHLTGDQVAGTLRHTEELDHYETLPRQLELLAAAGFARSDCVWRKLTFAVSILYWSIDGLTTAEDQLWRQGSDGKNLEGLAIAARQN